MAASKSAVSDKKLTTVSELRVPVRIERVFDDAEPFTGVVVAFGDEWVVVQRFDASIGFDGYVAVRRGDLGKAKRRRDREEHLLDTIEAAGWSPVCPPELPLHDRFGIFEWLLESSEGLTTLRAEQLEPARFACGELVDLGKKRVTFEPVAEDGTWLPTEQWQLKTVTLIEFGGSQHEDLLRRAVDAAATGDSARD